MDQERNAETRKQSSYGDYLNGLVVPQEPDAKWGVQHIRKIKTLKSKKFERIDYFNKYEVHVIINPEKELKISLKTPSGVEFEGLNFCSLVDKDLVKSLPLNISACDRGYDYINNHFI